MRSRFFADVLNDILDVLEVRQEDLAKAIVSAGPEGVSQQAISLWMKQGYIPLKRIADVQRFVDKAFAEMIDRYDSDVPLPKDTRERLSQALDQFKRILDDMADELENKNKQAIEELEAIHAYRLKMRERAEYESDKLAKKLYDKESRHLMMQADKLSDDFRSRTDGPSEKELERHARYEKRSRRIIESVDADRIVDTTGTTRRGGFTAKIPSDKDPAAERRAQWKDEVNHRRWIMGSVVNTLGYLPGTAQPVVEANGKDRRIDYLTDDGIGVELTWMHMMGRTTGRYFIDHRPISSRIMEMAVMVKTGAIKKGYVLGIGDYVDFNEPDVEAAIARLSHLALDARDLGVNFQMVFGNEKEIGEAVLSIVTDKPFNPEDYELPIEDDDDYDFDYDPQT